MFVLFAAFYLHLMLLFRDYFQSTFDIFNEKSQCFNQLNFIVCDKWQWKKLLHLLSFKHSKCEARRPPKRSSKNWNLIAFLMSWLIWGTIIADHFSDRTINTVKACLLTRNWTPLIGFKVFYCLRRRPSWSASERCANVTLWPSFVQWEKWENKTITVKTFYFNSMERL